MTAAVSPSQFLLSLDQLEVGSRARIASVDWLALDAGEVCRLKHFGFDEGVTVEPLHLGPFGRDPLAGKCVRSRPLTCSIAASAAS